MSNFTACPNLITNNNNNINVIYNIYIYNNFKQFVRNSCDIIKNTYMSSVGIFNVILPLISSTYFKYPNTPNTVYKDTTIVIVILRTLGQPRKW